MDATHTSPTGPSPTGPEAATLRTIAPGVYAWIQPDGTWWVNNAGAVAGEDAVLVIDTCATAERTRRFLAALDAATDGTPIRLAVNTHLHGDHTYGNSLLPATAVLLGHPAMRDGLRDDPIIDGCPPAWSPVPQWGPITRRLPDVTVGGSTTLHVGAQRVELHHPGGPAHTPGDLVAWLPDQGVLFTGDLVFAGLTPLVFMGSVRGALASVDWLAAFGARVLVPGHGEPATGTDLERVLDEHRRYYRFVLAVADDGHARGLAPLEAARAADLGEFAGWADAERLVLNLHREYADRAGRELDLMGSLADALAYNGGPLSTHV